MFVVHGRSTPVHTVYYTCGIWVIPAVVYTQSNILSAYRMTDQAQRVPVCKLL